MKVSFWYVRHGETDFNKQGRMQGQCNSFLSMDGIACMFETARALADVPFARAYMSPLGRCQQSADILMWYHPEVPLYKEENLKEMSFGDLDGKKFNENRELIMECLKEHSFAKVHGESDQDVMNRCRKAFAGMLSESQNGDDILVVSHGAYLRRLFAALLEKPVLPADTEIPNGSITLFDYEDGKYKLVSMPLTLEEYKQGIRK